MSIGTVTLADAAATEAFGRALANIIRPGDLIALSGPLGAGKTTLVRGVLAALGFAHDVPSPSFPIVIPYDPPEVRLSVWHVDLYRIEGAGELDQLGLDEAREEAVLLVEWPDRLPAGLRRAALELSLADGPGGGRRLTWTAPTPWETRWPPDRLR